ncbi:alanine/glycine:cation symporter family protein [Pseudobutyrivibrio sp. MD2005]|uniref:alanine/glycine:cation symporter family protein n=1 Tax=Pseudobutyrivibrio sp. MD2005 TaxID=1410616 RepID=UPI000482480C|nr:amino acid carrier protein [Pseudobutyrivibrio sp. MD2005]
MESLLAFITAVCGKIQVVSDLFWDFPTNFEWYANIPILGNFSLAIILLIGSGIYFSIRLKFIQVRKFKHGISVLKNSKAKTGISPLASFFLSTAMRVGPGNILGVTGAVSVGGPGALLWMWISAFFGMSTAFVESTLSQIFKEKKNDEYIGGMAFYGRRLIKNSAIVGIILSLMYIIYAILCFPAQGFNTVSAMGQIASIISGTELPTTHAIYWIGFVIVIIATCAVSFGGTRKISKVTDVLVPIMAIVYVLTVLILILINIPRIPWFFYAVFTEAFKPEAVFGGAFGIALMQGVKRGLMSNEAGQGTITMPAAASDAAHPCDQGCVQAIGVFLDTIVICTLTAFVVIMGRVWLTDDGAAWFELGKLPKYLASVAELTPGTAFNSFVTLLVSLCFGLFAFTCLLGFMSFSEICANRISKSAVFINVIRVIDIAVICFGMLTSIVGMDLGALWDLSDFANILIAYCNIPLLYIGFKYVKRAQEHFEKADGTPFTSKVVGIDVPVWDDKANK